MNVVSNTMLKKIGIAAHFAESKTKCRCACLVFSPLKKRRKNNSYVGNGNVGMSVVVSELLAHKIAVTFCDAVTAINYDVILVSITSTYDIMAFLLTVRKLDWWKRDTRKFKVIVGGAGLTNPTAIRAFCDYAIFGRCEGFIHNVVDTVLRGRAPVHSAIMHLPDISQQVVVAQADRLYHRQIGRWNEAFIGCKNYCKFCQYSWMHRHVGGSNNYVNTGLCDGNSPELMFRDLLDISRKHGRIRCAIDGASERLRYAYGKHISNDMIISGIEAVGRFTGTTILLVYNITNFPTETETDMQELFLTLNKADPANRVIMVLHSTPFRPSNLTPMQWSPAKIKSIGHLRATTIVDKPKFMAKHSFSLEGPASHQLCLLIERCVPAFDDAIDWMASNIRGDQEQVAVLFKANFPAVQEAITREYKPYSDNHPCDGMRSFTDPWKMKYMADRINKIV